MVCEYFSEFECSWMFVDIVVYFCKKLILLFFVFLSWNMELVWVLWQISCDVIVFLVDEFKVDSVNCIKFGIVEVIWVVLCWVLDYVFVCFIDDLDVVLFVGFVCEKGIVVIEMGGIFGQYWVVIIIKKVF